MKITHNKSEAEILRQKAEALLKRKSSKTVSSLSEAETLKLIHELEVHQIELEMQNDELSQAKKSVELAAENYKELYDFAPSGYFSLSPGCKIIKINLAGAQMLGKERSLLTNHRFDIFVSDDTRLVFNLFLKKVFKTKAKESCEVALATKGSLPMHVQLSGIVAGKDQHCLVTMTDITSRTEKLEDYRKMQFELNERIKELDCH
ncbi:MAG: PAS domain-containing protein, partial [Bacteroidota bacterium]